MPVNGVAYSTDSGATFQVSSNIQDGDCRYGAFPSESTWYVSQGMWPMDDVEFSKGDYFQFSSHMKLHRENGNVKMQDSLAVKYPNKAGVSNTAVNTAVNTTTGWWGGVSKTADGGKTWKQVYLTDPENDYVYFNQIACFTVDNCMVVAEGTNANNEYVTAAYVTFDGGASWDKTFESTAVASMMSAVVTSETEGWIAGMQPEDLRTKDGLFYKTTDGGKTFTLTQSLPNCMPIDMDFGDKTGAAACISSSGSSSSVAHYQ